MELFHVSLDLQDFIDIEERGRVRLSLIQTRDSVEDDRVVWIWEKGRTDERINVLITARFEVVVVETVVRILQY